MIVPKVIVTVAPTGGGLTRRDTPHVPTQPEEIAADVLRCAAAGASVAALHARRADDAATCDPQVYRRINELIRAESDIVLNNSTGGGFGGDMAVRRPDGRSEMRWDARLRGVDGGAEMCTLDAFTAWASTPDGEVLMDTPPSRARELLHAMASRGIKPEWEVLAAPHLVRDVPALLAEGVDPAPHVVNLVLGMEQVFTGAESYRPEVLPQLIALLPADSVFSVSVSGSRQTEGLVQALLLGGHVRVGIEDNPWYTDGVAGTNLQFVERIVRIIRELGAEPATPMEARQILGLAPLHRSVGDE